MNFDPSSRFPATTNSVTEPMIDLRAALRHFCPLAPLIQVLPKPSYQRLRGTVRDVSAKGLGVLCYRHLEPGSRVALPWEFGRPDQRRILLAHVAHTTALGEWLWLIGFEFDAPLREDELRCFLARARNKKTNSEPSL